METLLQEQHSQVMECLKLLEPRELSETCSIQSKSNLAYNKKK